MTRQTALLKVKQPVISQEGDLWRHAAVRPLAPSMMTEAEPATQARGCRDFSAVPARGNGSSRAVAACPLSPRTCPFGGACHTCPVHVQAKLKVSQPDDEYEREADRVADTVMRMPEPKANVQRASTACDEGPQHRPEEKEEEVDELLQAMAVKAQAPRLTGDMESKLHFIRGGGRPLPQSERNFFEPRLGCDFSQIRIHSDSMAKEMARAVKARAFTIGRDVVFGSGEYVPGTSSGRRLMAHELAHVIQQSHSEAATHRTDVNERATEVHDEATNAAAKDRQRLVPTAENLLHLQREAQAVPPQPVAPNQAQLQVIEAARRAAANRTQRAMFRARGIAPPSDHPDVERQRTTLLAQRIFAWPNPDLAQIAQILSSMVTFLLPGRAQVMIAGSNNPDCSFRAGYVRGMRLPIVLCPAFFEENPTLEQQARTMVHESAHLARVGYSSLAESYCIDFDCRTSCGGFDSADSWAHFVNCLSGEPADLPERLPTPEDDPMRRSPVEQSGQKHGLPPGDAGAGGSLSGSPNAVSRQARLSRPARPLPSAVYVSFQNAAPPRTPDHSQANPGPDGARANRAGYTRVRLQKHISIAWGNAPLASDGRIPLYIQSANIFYRLDPIEVLVSSDYAEGSCPYRVTLAHEQSHVEAFLRIFHAGRASLLERLADVAIPTLVNPVLVNARDIQTTQDSIGEGVRQVILAHSAGMVADMEADRTAKDAPAAYRAVYTQCPAASWEEGI